MLKKVNRQYHEISYGDGDVIFREGDESREMYIISEGEVDITKRIGQDEITLARLARGEFFGEMSLLESLPRTGTARAVGNVRLIGLHSGLFLKKIRRDPAFAFEIMQSLSNRLRHVNSTLALFLTSLDESDPARRNLAAMIEVGPQKRQDD
jgi:CRP/FNR family cyclic AMP-dependent transcriptional regulator